VSNVSVARDAGKHMKKPKGKRRPDWLSLNEVADELGICHEAARMLVVRGTLPCRRRRDQLVGGHQRIEVPTFAVVALVADKGYQRRTRLGCN
jgi:hypothetical protein